MLIRWLITVFPREMRAGWSFIRTDLVVWCSLAAALTLLALSRLSGQAEAVLEGPLLALVFAMTLMRVVLTPVVLMAAALRFRAIGDGGDMPWGRVAGVVLTRIVPGLAAWLAASGLCLLLSILAQQSVLAVAVAAHLTSTTAIVWASFVRWLVFVVVLVRFAFAPFLVALGPIHDGSEETEGWMSRRAWPLIESNRLTQDVRRQVLPYFVLAIYAPAAAVIAPTLLRPFLSFGLHLAAFTAIAVLFSYYGERRRALASP